jgi:hypothetical protein
MLPLVKKIAARFYKLVSYIQSDGSQPFELVRTRSFDYSVFNLKGLFRLANIGQKIGLHLWNYKNPQGARLKTALDYFVAHRQNWLYEQVTTKDTRNLDLLANEAKTHCGQALATYFAHVGRLTIA